MDELEHTHTSPYPDFHTYAHAKLDSDAYFYRLAHIFLDPHLYPDLYAFGFSDLFGIPDRDPLLDADMDFDLHPYPSSDLDFYSHTHGNLYDHRYLHSHLVEDGHGDCDFDV